MSWRDQLRDGSFRGASFVTENHDSEGGRRGEHHEFPQRDLPWFEDLGRAGRRWSITAFVIGANYFADRDVLIAACETKGPGTLVHPFLGTLTASCTSFRFSESTSEGGMARFTMDFVESGEPLAGDARTDTSAAAAATADAVADDAEAQFAPGFSVAGTPQFVEDAAAALTRRFATVSAGASLLLGGSGRALRAFEAGLSVIPAGAATLVRSSLNLALTVRAIIVAVAALGSAPSTRVRALRVIADDPATWPVVLGNTPARAIERTNQALLARLIVTVASAEAVRATAAIDFPSYDDAIMLRDSLAASLDDAAVRAADVGDEVHAQVLDALRRTMVRDITTRGGSLARLYRYTPRVTEPALVIAHRLYGASQTASRADELVARNRIVNPGFVPGGHALEVRTANG